MITPSRLPAAGPAAASGGVSLARPGDSSAAAPAPGHDFSSIMSQASHDRQSAAAKPSKLPPPPAPDQPRSPKPDVSVKTSDPERSNSDSNSRDASDDHSQSSTSDSAGAPASVDASISSTILALMTQLGLAPAALPKPVPAPQSLSALDSDEPSATSLDHFHQRSNTPSPSLAPGEGRDKPATQLSAPSPSLAPTGGEGRGEGAKLLQPKSPLTATDPSPAASQPPDPAKSPPADVAGPPKAPVAASGAPGASPPPPLVSEIIDTTTNSIASALNPNGTTAALNSQRMKFVAEKNETAGRTGQKVPRAASGDAAQAVSTVSSGRSADKSLLQPNSDLLDAKKVALDTSLGLDFSVKPAAFDVEPSSALVSAAPSDTSAAQALRVAHLVNQEVVTIRQSGANTLAVSLKLDPHTELFLHLTNHNGQIQATIRCERGDISGLGSHWADLQASLGKQNVQLLPLEHTAAARASASNTALPASASSLFNQSSQNQRQPARQLTQDLPAIVPAVAKHNSTTPNPKSSAASPRGWESWA